jgi:hypothetical protein
MKRFSQTSAAAGHFSKSVRSGAPPVISVSVQRQTRVILFTDDLGHPPAEILVDSGLLSWNQLTNLLTAEMCLE